MDSVQETLRRARQIQVRYKRFLQNKVEQDKSIEETFKRIDKTQQTLQQTKKTIGAIDNLYTRLEKVLAETIDNAVKQVAQNPAFNFAETGFQPKKTETKKIVQILKQNKRILILTGAGISAASGIPTFRGSEGFWTKSNDENQKEDIPAQTMLTQRFYSKNPHKTWKWLDDFYLLKIKSKPNKGHTALDDILQNLIKRGKQVSLVTQNIDNFHTQVFQANKKANKLNKPYPIYQIHGNILKIRCQNCSTTNKNLQSYSYQTYSQAIKDGKQIRCPKCQFPLRPHIMFFDDFYCEQINRSDTIRQFLEKTDVLIVIGTSLQTGLAHEIVSKTYNNEKHIIQINLDCEIKRKRIMWMGNKKADQSLIELRDSLNKK